MNILDKGSAIIIGLSPNGETLTSLSFSMYKGIAHPNLLSMTYVSMSIRAPLFVVMFLSQYLKVFPSKNDNRMDFYIPSPPEINAKSLMVSNEIVESMKAAIDTQVFNTKMYIEDGCDTHLAQLSTPISLYTTNIVVGNLNAWKAMYSTSKGPAPIEAYKKEIMLLIRSEYGTILSGV